MPPVITAAAGSCSRTFGGSSVCDAGSRCWSAGVKKNGGKRRWLKYPPRGVHFPAIDPSQPVALQTGTKSSQASRRDISSKGEYRQRIAAGYPQTFPPCITRRECFTQHLGGAERIGGESERLYPASGVSATVRDNRQRARQEQQPATYSWKGEERIPRTTGSGSTLHW